MSRSNRGQGKLNLRQLEDKKAKTERRIEKLLGNLGVINKYIEGVKNALYPKAG